MTLCCPPLSAASPPTFWATQPDACGQVSSCDTLCGRAGLLLVPAGPCAEPCPPADPDNPCPPRIAESATIATNDWLRGVILNMLGTRARVPTDACAGRLPAGGHWSESFMDGPAHVGMVLDSPVAFASVAEALAFLEQAVRAALQRLVARGIASKVEVSADYKGANVADVTATVWHNDASPAAISFMSRREASGWALAEMNTT